MTTDAPTAGTPSKPLDLAEDPAGKDDKASSTPAVAVTDAEKKIRRVERFGATVKLSEEEKRSTRAERFGTISPPSGGSPHGPEGSKQLDELKRKARAERFGAPAPANIETKKKKARLERFGIVPKTDAVEEDKRKARAARFSQATENTVSLNGNDTIEPKAAVAGNAGGS